MEKTKINKKITYSIVAILMIVLITIGATYAYFSAEKSTDLQTVTTGTLTMGFTNGEIVRATGITPINDNEIKTKATELPFTVTNTGSQHMKLTIKLTDITIADDLKDVDFRWGLYNADTNLGVSFGIFKDTVTGGEEILLRDVILDAGSATKNYVLRIWIHDDGSLQNYMQGETFSGKVTVTGEAIEYTPESCFTFDSSTGTITGYNTTSCPTENVDMVIPKTIGGVAVTKIGNEAFFEGDSGIVLVKLNSIVIPDTVVSIDSNAFNSNTLTHITIPSNINYLGSNVFANSSLNSVIIPEINIDFNSAFNYCSIDYIVVPGTITTVNGLESSGASEIILMEGITKIGSQAFIYNSFTSIEIPSSVTHVEESAFAYTGRYDVIIRGKSSLSDFTNSTGLTTDGGLPEGVNIIFRP